MAISNDLMRAIMAMDAYNRGYNAGVNISGNMLGLWTLGRATDAQTEPNAVAASFFAQAYTLGGQTIISDGRRAVCPHPSSTP
jgi:hypothetical protein